MNNRITSLFYKFKNVLLNEVYKSEWEAYVKFGYTPITTKTLIEHIIMILLLSPVVSFVGEFSILFLCIPAFTGAIACTILIMLTRHPQENIYRRFIGDGIFAMQFTFVLILAAYRFFVLGTGVGAWLLFVLASILIMNCFMWLRIILNYVKKHAYSKGISSSVNPMVIVFASVLGILFARIFLGSDTLSNEQYMMFAAFLLTVLALVFGGGSTCMLIKAFWGIALKVNVQD